MSNISLFPEQQSNPSQWHAYVSSALTILDSQTRDRVINLNLKIKEWLQSYTDTFVYLPQEYSDPSRGDKMKPEEIYILDRWRIAESDFVMMNLDVPSFGVGQEAEIACSMGIPIIAFHYTGNSVSRIIRGLPAMYSGEEGLEPSEGIIVYKDQYSFSDLKGALIAKVQQVQKSVRQVAGKTYLLESFSARLKKAISKSGKTVPQIAKDAGFTEAFLRSLLNEYNSIESVLEPYGLLKLCKMRRIPEDRYLNPGLWVLQRLSEALNIRLSTLIGEQELDRIWHEPLMLLSKKGVTLEEFLAVSEQVDYMVIYQKAARTLDKDRSSEDVAEEIFQLVKAQRDGISN